jgi:hypothetical protein
MSPSYTLANINQAIDDLESGRVGHPLVDIRSA